MVIKGLVINLNSLKLLVTASSSAKKMMAKAKLNWEYLLSISVFGFDEEEVNVRKVDESTFIFEGKTTLNDACKAMKLPAGTFDSVRGDSESLAGLVLELSGEFPTTNTQISVGDFEFTVLEAYKNRIMEIKVAIKPKFD